MSYEAVDERTRRKVGSIPSSHNSRFHISRKNTLWEERRRSNDSLSAVRIGVRTRAGGGKRFSLLDTNSARSWCLLSLPSNGYRGSFTAVKQQGRGVDHPPQSIAEVQTGYSYTSIALPCLHVVLQEDNLPCVTHPSNPEFRLLATWRAVDPVYTGLTVHNSVHEPHSAHRLAMQLQ
jgi:hypothetical protein